MPYRTHSVIKKKYEEEIVDIKQFKKPKLKNRSSYLKANKIVPKNISKDTSITGMVDNYFQAYNAARLSEACRVFAGEMLDSDVTVGMSLTGALTPAGLGSCVKPLMEAGFVDWIVSTGANMYHDTHFALGHTLHKGSPFLDDIKLRDQWVIRIYDVLFDADVLYSTDAFYRKLILLPEFQKKMPTSEFYYRVGKFLYKIEKNFDMREHSVLATAYKCGVPIYTSSPGDSSIGMNVAAVELEGKGKLEFDVNRDVNETAAIVLNGKKRGKNGKPGRSGVLIFGGGSPKNFMLQTEPQIQEVLGIQEKGKVDPDKLPGTIVCYTDTTIAMPILTAYALNKHKPRKLKRLAEKTDELMAFLNKEFKKANK